jgi:hypothetical protein
MSKQKRPMKIGAEHAAAMWRQGLAELRAAIYPDGNVAQPPQYGIYGTKTPGEVMEDRKGEVRDPDEKPSLLHEQSRETEPTRDVHESTADVKTTRDVHASDRSSAIDEKPKEAEQMRDVREPEPPEPEME